VVEGATNCAVGDGAGNYRLFIPSELNGMNLVSAHAACVTAGTTGTMDVQIHNVTQAADMLSTKITIDSTEKTSYTAATAPVIDGANDDVATGDELRIDVDAVHTTPAKGLSVILGFQLP
jgi:fibronectin type 3 domain-containing protein